MTVENAREYLAIYLLLCFAIYGISRVLFGFFAWREKSRTPLGERVNPFTLNPISILRLDYFPSVSDKASPRVKRLLLINQISLFGFVAGILLRILVD